MLIRRFIGDLFLPGRFYASAGLLAAVFIISFFIEQLFPVALVITAIMAALIFFDYLFLFILGRAPSVRRIVSDRLSNGDENRVLLKVQNRMPFGIQVEIIDELPDQFQIRDFSISGFLEQRSRKDFTYILKPGERGVYGFGRIILYARSRLGLLTRRFVTEAEKEVSVYPSFIHFRKYQLAAESASSPDAGARRARKIGQSMEFEQIKEYVPGDDIRTINWKATARKANLMVNSYVEEKSQQVYCLVDKGRLMKMPFDGLTLLDYAINSTLVLSGVCLQKQDRVGVLTFSDRLGSLVPADRKPAQREKIMQVLYRQQTAYLESDFEMLYMQVRAKIRQRSLLILYTNFESLNGLRRQLPYLRSMAKYHLLLVVFFENTELSKVSRADAEDLEDVYVKTIAEKFRYEKRLIVRELQKYGILSVLTPPAGLTVAAVNKYLELKNRQAL